MKLAVFVALVVAASAAGCSAAAPSANAPSPAASASASLAAVVTASPAATASASASASPMPTLSPTPTPTEEPSPTEVPSESGESRRPRRPRLPTDTSGNYALAVDLNPSLRLADGRAIKFATAGIGARNGSWWADDAIPAFATLDLKMAPDKAKAGGTYVIAGAPGMTLTGGAARAYRRSQLSGDSGPGVTISGSPRTLVVKVADGKLVLQMPTSADTWVIDLGPQWQTKCLKGDGSAYPLVTTH
ncbi:MAG: hypothetical protein U0838_15430 [Chloroflexota bacterium]